MGPRSDNASSHSHVSTGVTVQAWARILTARAPTATFQKGRRCGRGPGLRQRELPPPRFQRGAVRAWARVPTTRAPAATVPQGGRCGRGSAFRQREVPHPRFQKGGTVRAWASVPTTRVPTATFPTGSLRGPLHALPANSLTACRQPGDPPARPVGGCQTVGARSSRVEQHARLCDLATWRGGGVLVPN